MRKLRTSLMACVLVFTMLIATCATSFAAVFTDEEIANAQAIVDDVKAEIADIIDIAKNGTNEEKVAAIDAYVEELKAQLVAYGVATDEELDAVETWVRAEIADVILVATTGTVAEKEAKINEYIANVKAFFNLTQEESDYVDEVIATVKAEVIEIVELVESGDEEAIAAKVDAYIEALKDILGITAEDEAEIAELVADIEALIEDIKDVTVEDIEAAVDAYIADIQAKIEAELTALEEKVEADIEAFQNQAALQLAKIAHKKYVKDSNYYVAIGGDTVRAANIGRDDSTYYELIGEELAIDAKAVNNDEILLPSQIVELVEANATEIEKADFITYQTDASSFIYATLMDTPVWDAEVIAIVDEVLAQVTAVLNADWEAEGNAVVDDIAAKVKEAVLEKLPETIDVDVDAVIDFCIPYVKNVISCVTDKKDVAYDEATGVIASIDPMVHDYAEKLAYVAVSYAVETAKAIETIQAINPDAALYVVGMYNPVRGLEIVSGDTVISAEEIFDYVIDATNLYYAAYAAANKNFAFVDVSEAATDGFEDQIDVTALEIDQLATMLFSSGNSMHANADGHEYIAKQILAATKCNYSAPAKLDNEKHFVECTICGDTIEEDHTKSYEKLNSTQHTVACSVCNESWTEDHTFSGRTCTECGYVKSSGGGSGSGSYIKEETPTTTPFNFTDVSKDAWYYDVIKKVVDKGLMNGISETKFAPELEVTRGMFVTILYRAAGEPEVSAATNFADVTTDKYYAKAVAWANANGIVKGITETEFAPDNNITREQMAAILYRYAKNKAATGEITYTDKHAISDYALDAVAWAKAAGIMQGNADGTFAPVRNASRAEAAAVFVRMFKL